MRMVACLALGIQVCSMACVSQVPPRVFKLPELMTQAKGLDGSRVRVEGVIVIRRGNVNLFASEKDARRFAPSTAGRCMSLDLSTEQWDEWETRSGSKVVMEAEVDWDFCRDPEWICMLSCTPEGLINISSIEEQD